MEPHKTATVEISDFTYPSVECYLELSFTLRSATAWAPSGYEVAFGQIQLIPHSSLSRPLTTSTIASCKQTSNQFLEITGSRNLWVFDEIHGKLISWKKEDTELLKTPPVLEFYRALTDNDRPDPFGRSWIDSRLNMATNTTKSVICEIGEKSVKIVVEGRFAPPVLAWSIDTITTYTFQPEQVKIKVKGSPRGDLLPNTLARIGLTMGLNDIEKASWFGRGPGESYQDSKLSQRYGNHSLETEELFTDYEFPQEGSNRTDVRRVEFIGKGSIGLEAQFGGLEGASFAATHYTTKDLDQSQHPYELYKKKKSETIIRLDWAHQGLGTGSCGPATLPQYQLKTEPFEYEVLLK